MELRMRVQRVLDFGLLVSVIGTDAESGKPVTVYVDYRPFQPFCQLWQAGGYPAPSVLDAAQVTLSLNLSTGGEQEGGHV